MALKMPMYATIDVENRDQAANCSTGFRSEVVLKGANLGGLAVTSDAYRLPDYKRHPLYVFGVQPYALKLRLHVAVVGGQIVAATRPEVLRQAIDASLAPPKAGRRPASSSSASIARARPRLRRLPTLLGGEGPGGLPSEHQLVGQSAQLYGVPMDGRPRLSEAKYGVRYFCPDDGQYRFDAERNQVVCTVHGNREDSQQSRCPKARPRSAGSSRASTK